MLQSARDLQLALNSMAEYCKTWALSVNIEKTKVCVFPSRICRDTFTYENHPIELVKELKYLGVIFSSNGNFHPHINETINKANCAIFGLQQKIRALTLLPDIALDLFDKLVSTILLYGCEIWGVTDYVKLEQVHLKFCKSMLKLRKGTTSNMVYGETGRFPLSIDISIRMISFWHRLCLHQDQKLAGQILTFITHLYSSSNLKSPWLDKIKNILISCGIPFIFYNPLVIQTSQLKQFVKIKLKELFTQNWYNDINRRSSCTNYRIFKEVHQFEKYLLLPPHLRIPLCRLRCRNGNLPIVLSQFAQNNLDECRLCDRGIGDEFHYILECPFFSQKRKQLIPSYYFTHPNTMKFNQLLNCVNHSRVVNVAKLCLHIFRAL